MSQLNSARACRLRRKADYQTAYLHQRKADGVCVDCGKVPPRPGSVRCEACAARKRVLRREKIAKGLCPRCSRPSQDGRVTCPDCLAKGRTRADKRRKERRQAGLCILCGKNTVPPPYTICLPCRIKKRAREGRYRLDGGSREAVLIRDGYVCQLCGTNKDVRVHHIDGANEASEMPNHSMDNLTSICRACHYHVHKVAQFCNDLDLFLDLVKQLR